MALATSLLRTVGIDVPERPGTQIASILWNRARIVVNGAAKLRDETAVPPGLLERIDTLGAVFQEITVPDVLRGAALHGHYLRYALAAGEPRRLLKGLVWEAINASILGGKSNEKRGSAAFARVHKLAQEHPSNYAAAMTSLAEAGHHLFSARRFAAACTTADSAEAQFQNQCAGTSWERNFATLLRYTALEFAGNLKVIDDETAARSREAGERDDRFASGLLVASVSYRYLMRDDPQAALAFLDGQEAQLGAGYTTFHHLVFVRTIDAYLYRADGMGALRYLERTWPKLAGSFVYRGRFLNASAHYFRARAALAAYSAGRDPAHLRLARPISNGSSARTTPVRSQASLRRCSRRSSWPMATAKTPSDSCEPRFGRTTNVRRTAARSTAGSGWVPCKDLPATRCAPRPSNVCWIKASSIPHAGSRCACPASLPEALALSRTSTRSSAQLRRASLHPRARSETPEPRPCGVARQSSASPRAAAARPRTTPVPATARR